MAKRHFLFLNGRRESQAQFLTKKLDSSSNLIKDYLFLLTQAPFYPPPQTRGGAACRDLAIHICAAQGPVTPCLTLHTSPSKEKETSQKKVHVKHFSSHKYVYLQRLCIQRWDQTAAREAGSTSNTVTMPNTNPTHWARPHHR